MPAPWIISHFPRCEFHVFLSHCAEDRAWLVRPLFEQLKRRRIIPWIDWHHYPSGTDPYEALRDNILRCRHVVYLITEAMLTQGRGWVLLEKAFAGLLQDNLRYSSMELCHVELPLCFLPRPHAILPRSAWQPIVPKGRFSPLGNEIDWAAAEIERFVIQEQRRALDISTSGHHDPDVRAWINARAGLADRIFGAYPDILRA